jgi:PadR family transcriptional regulator
LQISFRKNIINYSFWKGNTTKSDPGTDSKNCPLIAYRDFSFYGFQKGFSMKIRSLDNLTPMTPQAYYILLALAQRPLHGYAILQQVAVDSSGLIVMSSGSLYTSLKRMSEFGLVKAARRVASERSPYSRHQYKLTSFGRQLLQLETRRLAHCLRLAKQRRA